MPINYRELVTPTVFVDRSGKRSNPRSLCWPEQDRISRVV